MSAYCYQVSRFQSIFHDKDDLGLHEDVIKWWVDFVYFTNLPFSLEIYTYLYNDNVINVFFNIIDLFTFRYNIFWCTGIQRGRPCSV